MDIIVRKNGSEIIKCESGVKRNAREILITRYTKMDFYKIEKVETTKRTKIISEKTTLVDGKNKIEIILQGKINEMLEEM